MKHVQLSVDAARWPDDALAGLLSDEDTGRALTGPQAREHLRMLKDAGFEVFVPCGLCECDELGRCTGVPLASEADDLPSGDEGFCAHGVATSEPCRDCRDEGVADHDGEDRSDCDLGDEVPR